MMETGFGDAMTRRRDGHAIAIPPHDEDGAPDHEDGAFAPTGVPRRSSGRMPSRTSVVRPADDDYDDRRRRRDVDIDVVVVVARSPFPDDGASGGG
jgi:hypothetical protein